ncbi:hypothetical protein Lfu02_75880 [Longispora fulva]|uniref:Flp pilus assembly protein TadB n=1 Tax=Longispora fulva TaxID=619741 RepID=A0A8J7KFJ7_9ACTN|nr:type II secretion system F family protein [Longispora fulva]MBG6136275.1 Flp pilus assembly protein TadB [Longispora fulva]GIG63216.1 hypothetical protein Lfu02_75880 [Longispora fulva]
MIATVLIGAGFGLGCAVVCFALWPATQPLAIAVAAVRRPPPEVVAVGRRRRVEVGVAGPLMRLGLPRRRTLADLAVCDRDPAAYLAGLVAVALVGLFAPPATVVLLDAMGAGLSVSTPVWVGMLLGAAGVWIAESSLHERAQERRLLMRHTLAALLDIVPPALAAGAGVEQALRDSATIASGWAADRIRQALDTAGTTRVPLWEPLAQLGRDTGVVHLEQLATTLQLASGEGTRIRAALTQRGKALSERLAADLEARAESASEHMSIPLMLLTSVFLLFLVYPGIAGLRP